MQNLYGNVLEATFLIPSEVCVHVWAEEVRELLLHKLSSCERKLQGFESKALAENLMLQKWNRKQIKSQEVNTYQTLGGLRYWSSAEQVQKSPSESRYIFKQPFSQFLTLFWNILEDFMPTSWTLLSLRTLLSWVNKCGDGFKLYKQAVMKPMNSMRIKQAIKSQNCQIWIQKVKYFESQINKPFDSAGDCQWRSKALK